jgi:hypothetical protein
VDLQILLFVLFGAAAVAFSGWILVRALRVAKVWRAGLEAVARRFKLRHVKPAGAISAIYDLVDGEHEGFSIAINIEDESRLGSDHHTRYMVIAIGGPHSSDLHVGKRGGLDDPNVVDYSDARSRTPMPTGDAVFDQQVEVRGAQAREIAALREDAILRQTVLDHVRSGGTIEGCTVRLKTRKFPARAEEFVERVEQLIELSRQLGAPKKAARSGAPEQAWPGAAPKQW